MHEVIHFNGPSFSIKANRFHRRIKTYPVPEFETVGKGLFRTVNTHTDTIKVMNVHTCGEGFTCEAICFNRWIIYAGFFSASL